MTTTAARPRLARYVLPTLLALSPCRAGLAAMELLSIAPVRIMAPVEGAPFRPVMTPQEIERRLQRLVGAGCDTAAVEERLGRRYRFLGYVPLVRAACEDGVLTVTIRESSHRIDLIAFDAGELKSIGITADPFYREEQRPGTLYPILDPGVRGMVRGLLQTREGDIYNAERYRSDSEALARLGYLIAFIPGPERGDEYPSGAYLIQSRHPGRKKEDSGRKRTQYLGGTASYGPREKGALGLLYQKDELFGLFDSLSLSPTYSSALGGEISYRAPIVAAGEEPRRLYDLQIGLFSYFTHNRLLAGIESDERRTGGSFAVGIRPLGRRAPHELRYSIGASHSRVSLEPDIPATPGESLTMLRLGLTHEWRRTYRYPSLTTRLSPLVEVAFDAAGGDRDFVRAGLDLTLHARVPVGVEFDLHLRGGTIDRQVPVFELWSLGGPSSVRGFREDTYLARHLAALQTEVWFPFVRSLPQRAVDPPGPIVSPDQLPLEPRGARLIKWALFLDGGYASGTTDGRSSSIAGAGLGVRFVVPHSPLVIRVDYGWGLGGEGTDSFPYLSLAYRF